MNTSFQFKRIVLVLAALLYFVLAFTIFGRSILINSVENIFPLGSTFLRIWIRFVGWFQDTALLQIALFLFLKGIQVPECLNAASAKLGRFLKNNAAAFCAGAVVLTVIYGSQFYMFNVRLDTDMAINTSPGGTFIWLDIGRYGAVFTRFLTDQLNFNPYFVSSLGFVVLFAAMVVCAALFWRIGKVPVFLSVFIFCLFFSHPVWMAQTYYTLQTVALNWGIALCFLAVYFVFASLFAGSLKIKIAYLSAAFLSIWWLAATYQSLVLLFVAVAIFSLILCCRQFAPPICRKLSVWLMVCAVAALAVHFLITALFFSTDMDYLAHRTCWANLPLGICAASVGFSMERILTGALNFSAFYSRAFLFVGLAALVVALRQKQGFWLVLLLQALPFLMIFASGVDQVPRSQLVLPFVLAADFLLLFLWLEKQKLWLVAAGVLLFGYQAGITMRLQYTDDLRFQNDVLLANRIEERLATLNLLEKPVVFVGEKARLNRVTVKERGEYLGESLAIYSRFHDFAQTQGIHFLKVEKEKEEELRQKALELSKTMPDFPHGESVKETEDFVLVKLSEFMPK